MVIFSLSDTQDRCGELDHQSRHWHFFSGQPVKTLWAELGTDGETYVLLDRNGTLFAGGGLNATPNDLERFTVMILNDGMFNGRAVIDQAIIQQLSDGANIDAFTNGTKAKGVMGNGDWSYRVQWWVRHTPGHEAFTGIGVNWSVDL